MLVPPGNAPHGTLLSLSGGAATSNWSRRLIYVVDPTAGVSAPRITALALYMLGEHDQDFRTVLALCSSLGLPRGV